MPIFTRTNEPVPAIVLLTDFGFRDSYVGVMKGVISGICPTARVIDLSHNIIPHDVAEAAFVLSASREYFPRGSIFVCVVDPGVGTKRDILHMRSAGHVFLAPDNGLLSVISEQFGHDDLRAVTCEDYFLPERSNTFHGRDIFAPVAAHLAAGLEVEKLGEPVHHLAGLRLPRPLRSVDGSLHGEVIYVDRFGNLITNVRRSMLENSFSTSRSELLVQIKGERIQGLSTSYAQQAEGALLALVGSTGYMEVAVNCGSAAQTLDCGKGDSVTLGAAATMAASQMQ
jgi:S-adenosyl-L-methionine hydrolase (adenosine-forming)